MQRIEDEAVVKVALTVESCLDCGSDNIGIFDYGYNSPNLGGGKCKDCGKEVVSACSIFPEKKALVDIWNGANSIDLLIEKKQKEIAGLKSEIDELNLKKAKRTGS